MSGVDPYAYMHRLSLSIDSLNSREEIELVLEEIEFLFEVLPPEMLDDVETLIQLLQKKLTNAK